MALDKFKNFLSGKDDEGNDSEYYNNEESVDSENKMILLEPRAYSESQQIADYLKNRSAVVVNLKRVTPDQAKRIVDFLYGTIYAIGGDLQKLGGGIFLCTPNNINVEGKITDENDVKPSKSKKAVSTEEDEFNW